MYAYGKLFPDDGADSFEERVYADLGADGLLHPYLGGQAAEGVDAAQFGCELLFVAALCQMALKLVLDDVAEGVVGQVHRGVDHVRVDGQQGTVGGAEHGGVVLVPYVLGYAVEYIGELIMCE